MIGIVCSTADRASVTIAEELLNLVEWTETEPGVYRHGGFELREFDQLHLELDEVAAAFDDPEYVVVASKHSGDSGPLLSAHFTGNFGAAEYGGEPRSVSQPAPGALKHVIRELDNLAPEPYEVAMECTHHGPTEYGAPAMFVELGSGPEQWDDSVGGRAVAEAILSLAGVGPDAERTFVAVGGNHYAPQPTRLLLETDAAIGHVAADWSLEELGDPEANRDLVQALFERSNTSAAVFDGDYPEVAAVVESLGYEIVSETWIRETSGVDPALVERLESRLGAVEEGLRFGERTATEDLDVRSLPSELLDAAAAIDPADTVATVAAHTVAYQSEENGNRVGDRAALPDEAAYDALIDGLVGLLEREFETVKRVDGQVIAEREGFDPALAADHGVPEGPLFGRLAAGESVTVDGETIEPETVSSRETQQFDV
ncbi:D-aminoacyl-tRNA deacylase [Halodesulfurarchaeum formicicum]|uniref:D-aminoacyl-tRNA deacylase n=1 Tax=Halodesulfurarchaeum formicicum TaxID=1873524 RepID=A0A1D8S5E0_9EURY|nr:D-aminoacyl-tRNA deacylase [Halodesulfurarchaeum formicicum]AOW80571.1 D-aminoacyl-tRNA deacylase [Halodesulfurarchaeum formicicum]